MATFGDLYQDAIDYELGGNDSVVLFTTARRKHAINEGLRQFSDLTECWSKSSTITCSNAVAEYNLLSTVNVPGGDFVRLSGQGPTFRHVDASSDVQYVAGADLPRRDISWLDAHAAGWRDSTGGTPESYYLRDEGAAKQFGLYPPPHISTSESATILLPYVAKPSSMTSSADVPWSGRTDLEPYHQALPHYAASKLEKLRKNTEASQSQLAAFLGYVQRFVVSRQPKGGRTIRTTRSYFTDAGRRGSEGQIEIADT